MTSPWAESQHSSHLLLLPQPCWESKAFSGLNDLEPLPVAPSLLGSACASLALCKYTCMLILALFLFLNQLEVLVLSQALRLTRFSSYMPVVIFQLRIFSTLYICIEKVNMSRTCYSATGAFLRANSFLPVRANQVKK